MSSKYPLDPDRGAGAVATVKQAVAVDGEDFAARAEDRAGLRELDGRVEQMAGLSRQTKDANRVNPRATVQDLPSERMRRRLPAAEAVRGPLSSRQRKARNVGKRTAQDRLPQTQYQALQQTVQDKATWDRVNDQLSAAAGDVEELDDRDRQRVRRLDRAIQSHERFNDRGHVVYTDVTMPPGVNSGNIGGFLRNQVEPGDVFEFDRYTAATHSLHELDGRAPKAHRTVAFEIQTRRGAYLGRSDSLDDTRHLLPRSMRLQVVGTHRAAYKRPDGSSGQRWVVQLQDLEEGA